MPSMSAAISALRAAGWQHLSASKFVARHATGSHVLQIDTYAQASRMMPPGEKIRSDKFRVGGHDWRLECYPNGSINEGFISLYLNHASHAKTVDATAKFRFSVLDQSCWRPLCTKSSEEPYLFSESDAPGTNLSWGFADFIKHGDLDKEKHLKDECLNVLCDVTVTVTGLHADDHTDIEAGGETFAVHRWLLEAQSPVFKADLSLALAAGDGAAELRIDDMDVDVCKAMLEFIYTGSLDPRHPPFIYDGKPVTGLPETAGGAERMLIAADRYKLEKLKQICVHALTAFIRVSSVAATLALAKRHHCPKLREACISFIFSSDNLKALVETGEFEKIKRECPSDMKLLVKQMAQQK
ncbi:unnamed protein product [Alopecurus aequalis]